MESTKESADSIKELIVAMKGEGFQDLIKEIGKSFGQIVSGGADFLKFFVDFETSMDSIGESFERAGTEVATFLKGIKDGLTTFFGEIKFNFSTELEDLKDDWEELVNFLRSLVGLEPWGTDSGGGGGGGSPGEYGGHLVLDTEGYD